MTADRPTEPALPGPTPLEGFRQASEQVLDFLQTRHRFGLWMVTRTVGESWVALTAFDRGYGVVDGDLFRWSDSLCSRMVRGEGPRVAPDVSEVPSYRNAPIARQLHIGAYVGVPLLGPDGELFGTLCGIDPLSKSPELIDDRPLFELQARLLSTILAAELHAVEEARRAERAESEASLDPLTGVLNRRGWERMLVAEEARAARYGDTVAVLVADLDGLKSTNDLHGHQAGDQQLKTVAAALSDKLRASDVLARLGGDEFAVLLPDTDTTGATLLAGRLSADLDRMGVPVSIGVSERHPRFGLDQAVHDADRAMYDEKRRRHPSEMPRPIS
jgi:diguanylate cyclase (GGDEF)-like protein